MKKNIKKRNYVSLIARAFMIFVVLLLSIYFVSVITGSSDFFTESAEKNAKLYVEEDIARAEALANAHYDNLYEIAEKLKYSKSRYDVEQIIESYIGSEEFGDLRYYSQGKAYSANGTEVDFEVSGKDYIEALAASNTKGCSPVYYDTSTQLYCMAFFVPIRGSECIDGILSIVPARNIINVGEVINEKAGAVAIIDPEGKVLSDTVADSFDANIGSSFYLFIDNFTHNKADSERIGEAVSKKVKTALTISSAGGRYTLAISPLSVFDNNVTLISISASEGLIAPEHTYIRHVINMLIIAIAALIVGFVYSMGYYRKSKQALNDATLVDSELDCPNATQFKIKAKDLMARYKNKYSVVVVSLRNFFYIGEQLGDENSKELLRAMIKVIVTLTRKEECYGYAGDGKFLMLTVNANSHTISDKIRLLETISNREVILKENKIKVKLAAGVYNVFSGRKRTVQEMIDCANTACGYSEESSKSNYTLFTEEVRAEIERNEKIESIMESALENREFRLFLQPKYNVKKDAIDSAEALVRWYDPRKGDYRFPGEFIPLFEANGFITKLDHFIYIEVLEYLSKATERGETVVPIAVNVSRVTATSPDFINFYVGNKQKYRIPDGFITLELTESFAMEDYEKIFYILTALHNGGLRCSIDDFGSGYSSFSILKQITVDELKLDSVFVKRGLDIARDDKLLATIIDLGKSMGMSVVQEGVETKELFDKVVGMGCDIIQGYYYARAIPLEEFKVFLSTNTSIKYKSLVK
jgi:EAL domain-containing protein (putative c-di-GMP-specific phosphodiesterase class I)/GGDEF domain-containing protein